MLANSTDGSGGMLVQSADFVRRHKGSTGDVSIYGQEREEDDDFDFEVRLTELHEELEVLNAEAHELEARINENVAPLLSAMPRDGGE
jgi:type I restriction enzyme M protein